MRMNSKCDSRQNIPLPRVVKQILLVLAYVCYGLVTMSSAWAADDYVTVSGQGVNRQAAIQDAMRVAVENKVGVLLDSRTIFENNRILADSIYARSEGFIRSYEVIGEQNVGRSCQVTIRAIVDSSLNTELMNRFQKIKAVETGLQDPRIGVIIADKNAYDADSPTAENAIIKALMNNGFMRLIDTRQMEQVRKRQIASALLYNDINEALALLSQFPTDYMIIGEVSTSAQHAQSRGFGAFISGRAIIDFRVYNVSTGEIAYADTVEATEVNTNGRMAASKAIQAAANQAGKALAEGLLRKAANPLHSIQVMVDTERGISEVQQLLRSVYGVQQAYLRDSRKGFMLFDLNYNGTVDTFASCLEQNGIRVSETSSQYVKFVY